MTPKLEDGQISPYAFLTSTVRIASFFFNVLQGIGL